jgi:hypothetical protein
MKDKEKDEERGKERGHLKWKSDGYLNCRWLPRSSHMGNWKCIESPK